MANSEIRKIAIDELVEAAAAGVLRALDARTAAAQGKASPASAQDLVKSGFFVDFKIRAGGIGTEIINSGTGTGASEPA